MMRVLKQLSGIAGLAITYGLTLNTLQAQVVWSMCTLENKIISVERILQYMGVPAEPRLSCQKTSWLRAGHRMEKSSFRISM